MTNPRLHTTGLSHAERLDRRREIAQQVLGGASFREAALAHGVSVNHARACCREFLTPAQYEAVKPRNQASWQRQEAKAAARAELRVEVEKDPVRAVRAQTLNVISDLIHTDDTYRAIGQRYGVSKSRVHQIAELVGIDRYSVRPMGRAPAKG